MRKGDSMNNRARANQLRRIADEMDPPTKPDEGLVVVYVSLWKDGAPHAGQRVSLPNIGDGWLNGHMTHQGPRIFENELPLRDSAYAIKIRRVEPEIGD